MKKITPVDEELLFAEDEVIVSKTDLKGRITYANDVFCRMAEAPTGQVLGMPHSIIRHPDMPRAIFQLLWTKITSGEEIFAYVKNMSLTGKYYWVIAHVTPSFDVTGKVVGFHSNRRKPERKKVQVIGDLYSELRDIERSDPNQKQGMQRSMQTLQDKIAATGMDYDEFIWGVN